MSIKRYRLLPFLLLFIAGFNGCKKQDVPVGVIPPDGLIALSFDDAYVDNWYAHLSLLDSLGIKATFYISSYHTLNNVQKQKLRTIEAHGNEIAYHTTNHSNLLKQYGKSSMRYVLDTEIKPDLRLMNNDGFNPENFAYPYGQHDPYLDRQLLIYFKSLRAVCNPKNYDKSLVKQSKEGQVFYSPRIDASSKITDEQIKNLLELARNNHNCVMLYAHEINSPRSNYQVTIERLKYLSMLAKTYNLQFVRVAEMTR